MNLLEVISSSLDVTSSSSSYHPPLTEKDILPLVIGVNEVKEQLRRIYLLKAMEYLQLPSEVVEPYITKIIKEKTPRLGRPLMEGEIKDAIGKTKSMKQAADYLRVHLKTLQRYCKIYDDQAKNNDPQAEPLWKPTRGRKTIKNET